jgi:hypothetical protein
MCGRPRGFKSFEENSDGRIDCDHVSGLMTRRHDRWPRWNPRSGPKQSSGLRSHWFPRAFRIVDSTDRHLCQLLHPPHPRVAQVVIGCGRLPYHASSWPLPVLPVGLSGWSITAETPWRFDCRKLREIELDNRL